MVVSVFDLSNIAIVVLFVLPWYFGVCVLIMSMSRR